MTDNTPRPEPMSRESVLAVLDENIAALRFNRLHGQAQSLKLPRAAVAALYVKNAQLEAQLQERISELFAMELERDALRRAVERKNHALRAADEFITNGIELGFIRMPEPYTTDSALMTPGLVRSALAYTGTKPSDAEGGG